ncbi:hypothetical protein KR093_000639 [Drosophila rubida]|uniref:C-type lectin domain-containing protein n=1 Tax=Drosophila rubida TaxID=30044 RepID=A0AAD4PK17_9MUSC|nr:hypothetical protein KR093_000639 [Drosophila rubida]
MALIEPFEKMGSKYYYIENTRRVSWFSAVNKCQRMGGHLANLRTQDELTAIMQIKASTYWVDLTELSEKGTFRSFTTGEPKGIYPQWAANEPNNALKNEHCGQVYVSDKSVVLNDHPCETKYFFICEANLPRSIKIVYW